MYGFVNTHHTLYLRSMHSTICQFYFNLKKNICSRIFKWIFKIKRSRNVNKSELLAAQFGL